MTTPEIQCVDALVTASLGATRYALLGARARSDSPGWALPGGKVEPGDLTPLHGAIRELREETGLDLLHLYPAWQVGTPQIVPDPRPGQWVTRLCRIHLGSVDRLPPIAPLDGFTVVAWVGADSFRSLTAELTRVPPGMIFPAHIDLLAEQLG